MVMVSSMLIQRPEFKGLVRWREGPWLLLLFPEELEEVEVNEEGIPLNERLADKLLDNAEEVEPSCGGTDDDSGIRGTE